MFTKTAGTVKVGETITFDASGSYDPDGTIVSYLWDFGDGGTSSEAVVSHSYEDDGEYTVTLRVADNEGLTDNKMVTQVVNNRQPIANFTVSASTVGKNVEVVFDASSSYDLDGSIVQYTWGFDDGTMASGATVNHTFTESGVYEVTLTVNDDDGATDSASLSVTVTQNVMKFCPVARFMKSAEKVNIYEPVSVDASESYDSDGTIVSYLWDFGDGNTATGVTAAHAYSTVGDYTVTLTVTDNDGDSTSATDDTLVESQTENENGFLEIAFMIGWGLVVLLVAALVGFLSRRKKKRETEA